MPSSHATLLRFITGCRSFRARVPKPPIRLVAAVYMVTFFRIDAKCSSSTDSKSVGPGRLACEVGVRGAAIFDRRFTIIR